MKKIIILALLLLGNYHLSYAESDPSVTILRSSELQENIYRAYSDLIYHSMRYVRRDFGNVTLNLTDVSWPMLRDMGTEAQDCLNSVHRSLFKLQRYVYFFWGIDRGLNYAYEIYSIINQFRDDEISRETAQARLINVRIDVDLLLG